MNNKKAKIISFIAAIIALLISFIFLQIVHPGYLIRSITKIFTFSSAIILYSVLSKERLRDIINFKKFEKPGILLVSIALFFCGIIILFTIFKNRIDIGCIRQSLIVNEHITRKNCIFAFAYIIFFNSFLEESFFRGFLPRLFSNKYVGYVTGAVLFSAYHISIVSTWFDLPRFILCVTGLVAVGLFLQWINVKFKTILANWLIHASANLAINIIGALILFNIL